MSFQYTLLQGGIRAARALAAAEPHLVENPGSLLMGNHLVDRSSFETELEVPPEGRVVHDVSLLGHAVRNELRAERLGQTCGVLALNPSLLFPRGPLRAHVDRLRGRREIVEDIVEVPRNTEAVKPYCRPPFS